MLSTVTPVILHPWVLWLLVPVVWFCYRHCCTGSLQGWCRLTTARTTPASLRYYRTAGGRRALPVTALIFLCTLVIMLAGPGYKSGAAGTAEDVSREPVIALVHPDIATAQNTLQTLHRIIESNPGRPVALVLYSGSAHILSPLTSDTDSLHYLLQAVSPEVMPVTGNNPASAITLALKLLRESGYARAQLALLPGTSQVSITELNKMVAGHGRLHVLPAANRAGSLPDALISSRDTATVSATAETGTHRDISLMASPVLLLSFLLLYRRQRTAHKPGGTLLPVLSRMPAVMLLPLLITGITAAPPQARAIIPQPVIQPHSQKPAQPGSMPGNLRIQAENLYNLGNAKVRQHQYLKAIQDYDAALALNPALDDAVFNRKIARQLLARQNKPVVVTAKTLTPAVPDPDALRRFYRAKFAASLRLSPPGHADYAGDRS